MTAWHRETGIRFLLEDYRCNGIDVVPHYHCSALLDLRSKYDQDPIISKILGDTCCAAKKDEWKVTAKCGECTICSQCRD